MKKSFALAAAALALIAAPIQAHAQACTAATVMTSSPGYLNCAGSFGGNINGSSSELTTLTSLFGGTWTWAGQTGDGGFGPFAANATGTSGTVAFDNLVTGPFVIGVKAADRHSFYLFDGGIAGILSVPYESIGTSTNAKGLAQDVSHLGLYRGAGTVVPEPSTYALMGTGLMGLAGLARRRRTHA